MNNFRCVVSASSLLALLAALAVSGCEKTNDLPVLKDEAVATAKTYQEQLDDLAHRAQVIGQRLNTLPAQALTRTSPLVVLSIGLALTVCFLLMATSLFRRGLRRYTGATS